MKEYFIVKYGTLKIEFFRDYINGKDIWYDIAINDEGKSLKYRMHNNKDQTWKITGNRTPAFLLRLEEDFSESIGKNETV